MNTVQQHKTENKTTNQDVPRGKKITTKQEILDKTPENLYEVALQNLLHSLSKTKLEQIKRVFNEINSSILYKTQLRELKWIEIHTAIIEAVNLNNPTLTDKDETQ